MSIIGVLCILSCVSALTSNKNLHWYCINCGYSANPGVITDIINFLKDPRSQANRAVITDINFFKDPHFIFEPDFRKNTYFLNSPEELKSAFETAYREYVNKNYLLARDTLEKILLKQPDNKAALLGKLGLLFKNPLAEIRWSEPLEIIKIIGKYVVTENEKKDFCDAVLKIFNLFYHEGFNKGVLTENKLPELLIYLDYLAEFDEGNYYYLKHALNVINRCGFPGGVLWHKYHDILMEKDEVYKSAYEEQQIRLDTARRLRLDKTRKLYNIITYILIGIVILIVFTIAFLIIYLFSLNRERNEPVETLKVSTAETNVPKAKVIFKTGLPLRERPSSNAKKIKVLSEGAVLTVKENNGIWCRVETQEGETGWVKNEVGGKPTLEFSGASVLTSQ